MTARRLAFAVALFAVCALAGLGANTAGNAESSAQQQTQFSPQQERNAPTPQQAPAMTTQPSSLGGIFARPPNLAIPHSNNPFALTSQPGSET